MGLSGSGTTSDGREARVGRALPAGWLAPLVVAGIVRALMLVPSIGQDFQGDESAYLALSGSWAQFGAYAGQWPPLQTAFLAMLESLFSPHGEAAARVTLSVVSLWSGAWLMALALRVHSENAARITGWIWALYLPLLPFSHVLLSEGLTIALLLPALTLLLATAQGELTAGRATLGILGAGVFLGLGCLTRESGLFWLATLGAWSLFGLRTSRPPALRRAALLIGAALVTIAPWSFTASRSLGSFQLLGRTAGVNAYMGWNANYVNFDLVGLDVPTEGVPGAALRARLLTPPDGVEQWSYEFIPDLGERNKVHVARGAAFARARPGFFLRTRAVKAADLATPLSFMTRFLRMPPGDPEARGLAHSGGYGPPLNGTATRLILAVLAVLSVLAVGVLGALGATVVTLRKGAASMFLAGLVATAPLALVVAMSRFRAPMEAFALVAVAAALASFGRGGSALRRGRGPWAACAALLLVLGGTWYLSVPAVVAMFRSLL